MQSLSSILLFILIAVNALTLYAHKNTHHQIPILDDGLNYSSSFIAELNKKKSVQTMTRGLFKTQTNQAQTIISWLIRANEEADLIIKNFEAPGKTLKESIQLVQSKEVTDFIKSKKTLNSKVIRAMEELSIALYTARISNNSETLILLQAQEHHLKKLRNQLSLYLYYLEAFILQINFSWELEKLKENKTTPDHRQLASLIHEIKQIISNFIQFHSSNKSEGSSTQEYINNTLAFLNSTLESESSEHTFDRIFNFYWGKRSLTIMDEKLLNLTYQLWSSFYEVEHRSEQSSDNNFKNVNPHNASYYYWLAAKKSGLLPTHPIPLLHADTHNDLLHVAQHLSHNLIKTLTHTQAIALLTINSITLKEYLDHVKKITNPEQFAQLNNFIKTILNKKSSNKDNPNQEYQLITELKDIITYHLKNNIKYIGQNMVGAMASNLGSSYIFSLPPWSHQGKYSDNIPSTGYLVSRLIPEPTGNRNEQSLVFVSNQSSPINFSNRNADKFLKPNDTIISTIPFFIDPSFAEQQELLKQKEKNKSIGNIISKTLDLDPSKMKLSDYLRKNETYILDIDLDVFASEGKSVVDLDHWYGPTSTIPKIDGLQRKEMPYSYERTYYIKKLLLQFDRFMHPSLEQLLDNNIVVTSTEMTRVKERIDIFFSRIEQAKIVDGNLPTMITIADSSSLQRAIALTYEDSFTSSVELIDANFTPKALTFLINYAVRKKN